MSKPKHCKEHVCGRLVAEILRICRFADRASHPPCKKHCKFSVFMRNAAKRRFWDHTGGGGRRAQGRSHIYIYMLYYLYTLYTYLYIVYISIIILIYTIYIYLYIVYISIISNVNSKNDHDSWVLSFHVFQGKQLQS